MLSAAPEYQRTVEMRMPQRQEVGRKWRCYPWLIQHNLHVSQTGLSGVVPESPCQDYWCFPNSSRSKVRTLLLKVQLRAAWRVADTKNPLPTSDPTLQLSGESSALLCLPHHWHRGTDRFDPVVLRDTEFNGVFFPSFSSDTCRGNEQNPLRFWCEAC